ncbi:hypothetical protein [Streptomyces sp. NBC_00057]
MPSASRLVDILVAAVPTGTTSALPSSPSPDRHSRPGRPHHTSAA